jgi:hypothetical protein
MGIPSVMVSGEWVIADGQVTGKHPGVVLRSTSAIIPDDVGFEESVQRRSSNWQM